jgi:hypothetical protein
VTIDTSKSGFSGNTFVAFNGDHTLVEYITIGTGTQSCLFISERLCLGTKPLIEEPEKSVIAKRVKFSASAQQYITLSTALQKKNFTLQKQLL